MRWRSDDNEHRRELRPVEAGVWPELRRDERLFVNLASNNYLGLAHDERVIRAAQEAASRYGAGGGASSLLTGYTPLHEALASDLAELEQTEASVVLPTGFAANLAATTALIDRRDHVFADALNHASLLDGCRLTGARVRHYAHRNTTRLQSLMDRVSGDGATFIVSDSVFSMDGTIAPVADLIRIARARGAVLIVDEAHATGIIGEQGAGAVSAALASVDDGMTADVVRVGTLSKALGAQGGFIAANRAVIDRIVNRARAFLFSTALAPAAVGAARRALELMQVEPERRIQLHAHVERLRAALVGQGFDVIGEAGAPMISVVLGEARVAVDAARFVESRGILAPAIRPPTVKPGRCRLRLSPMATHTSAHIDRAIDAFAALANHQAVGATA